MIGLRHALGGLLSLSVWMCGPSAAWAGAPRYARIVVLAEEEDAVASQVMSNLRVPMKSVGVRARLVEVSAYPEDVPAFSDIVDRIASRRPGVLGVFGWSCESDHHCWLYLMEPGSRSFVMLPVTVENENDDDEKSDASDGVTDATKSKMERDASSSTAASLAAGIREMVYGNLLMELPRVAIAARRGAIAPTIDLDAERAEAIASASDDDDAVGRLPAKRYAVHLVYSGGYVHPSSSARHGVLAGVALFPGRYVSPSVDIGSMGVDEGTSSAGRVRVVSFPFVLSLRLSLPLGGGFFLFGPRIQYELQVIGMRSDEGETSRSATSGLKVGGVTGFAFPVTDKPFRILWGASVMATAWGRNLKLDGMTTLARTGLGVFWYGGVSF